MPSCCLDSCGNSPQYVNTEKKRRSRVGEHSLPNYRHPFHTFLHHYVVSLPDHLKIVMAEAGCPASLIRLTSCPDVECKRLAVMTLCNLTANAETRAAATRGGGLQAAVRLTSDGDGECRRYAATCVCNMANDHQMQASC